MAGIRAIAGVNRTVGTFSNVDTLLLQCGDDGLLRQCDFTDQEGWNVQRSIDNDNARTVSLDENKITSLDMNVVDGGIRRQMDHIAIVGHDLDRLTSDGVLWVVGAQAPRLAIRLLLLGLCHLERSDISILRQRQQMIGADIGCNARIPAT
ncbi:hypothetical protein GFPCMMHI_05010 [Ensifer adhaerens]|nr:hypothetical protein [Ensifer adhaerens]